MHTSLPEFRSERTKLSSVDNLRPGLIYPDSTLDAEASPHCKRGKDGCKGMCVCAQAVYARKHLQSVREYDTVPIVVPSEAKNRVTFNAYPIIVPHNSGKGKDKATSTVADNVRQYKRHVSLAFTRATARLPQRPQIGKSAKICGNTLVNRLSDSDIICTPSLMHSPSAESRTTERNNSISACSSENLRYSVSDFEPNEGKLASISLPNLGSEFEHPEDISERPPDSKCLGCASVHKGPSNVGGHDMRTFGQAQNDSKLSYGAGIRSRSLDDADTGESVGKTLRRRHTLEGSHMYECPVDDLCIAECLDMCTRCAEHDSTTNKCQNICVHVSKSAPVSRRTVDRTNGEMGPIEFSNSGGKVSTSELGHAERESSSDLMAGWELIDKRDVQSYSASVSSDRRAVRKSSSQTLQETGKTLESDNTQFNTDLNTGSLGATAIETGQNMSATGIYPLATINENDRGANVHLISSKDQGKTNVVFGVQPQHSQSATNVAPMWFQAMSAEAQEAIEPIGNSGSENVREECEGDFSFAVRPGFNVRLTRWFSDYNRMRKLNLWVYLLVWLPLCSALYLPAYLINSQSLLESWTNNEDIAYGSAVLCCMITLVPALVISYYLHIYRDRPMVKSRGREFLFHLFLGGIFPCIILSFIEVIVFAAPGVPEWVYYVVVVLQNCTLNQFVIAIVARQRMIYRIFAAHSYQLSFSYGWFTFLLTCSWALSVVPFSVVFFMNARDIESRYSDAQFTIGWAGSIAQTLLYWGLFVYYSYFSRGAHEKFSDFYQNIRLAILSPTLFLALFIAASFYQYSPYASLVIPYLSWFIISLYMVDSFPVPLYLCARGVDLHIELAEERTPGSAPVRSEFVQAQMSQRLSQASNARRGVVKSASMSMPRSQSLMEDITDATNSSGGVALDSGETRSEQLRPTCTV
ncbi:hypothetical protein SARC_03060 [Sphaeroforma arctica JP610]|uniref:Transmembrane protein n=1 Tax=Sphaeroforma arctica JP610 TaxID=667725 RepID=A0A0L0G722_9EUKA|nr:hypothetical protein SARC_03060 [Sphaeroforma arctica JP610]KNC84719.1 hypothetical protein SARC_03060 [Sphaeroforma arctica JP610]|eukprot:XP_014158621.1 hypothetical protein SARC_03060 [Sphaeroforma arctica JP610]